MCIRSKKDWTLYIRSMNNQIYSQHDVEPDPRMSRIIQIMNHNLDLQSGIESNIRILDCSFRKES